MSNVLGRRGLAYAAAGASHYVARRLLISEGGASLSAGETTAYSIVAVALVIISGLFAGLTLGLLSLDRQVSSKFKSKPIFDQSLIALNIILGVAGLIWKLLNVQEHHTKNGWRVK